MNVQELLDGIKPHARPTWSARVDEIAATAATNGWTTQTLAAATNATIGAGTGTGYVIVTLDRLSKTTRPTTTTPTPRATHTYPAEPIPMPEWFKQALTIGTTEAFKDALTNQGIDHRHLTHLQGTPCPTCHPGTQCHHIDEYINNTLTKHRGPTHLRAV